jgi:hypothetical protein
MIQENLNIGFEIVPTIVSEEERYYPLKYIARKVMLRKSDKGLVNKHNEKRLENHIKKFKVNFGEAGIHESNCISKEGLILILQGTHVGRLSREQRYAQNYLHSHLRINSLSEKNEYVMSGSSEEIQRILNDHTEYDKEIIDYHIKSGGVDFRLCSKCDKYYPLHSTFYAIDKRAEKGFTKVCKVCTGKVEKFSHLDNTINYLVKKGSSDLYNAYTEGEFIPIVESMINGDIKRIPERFQNKEDYLKAVCYLIDQDLIRTDELSIKNIYNTIKLPNLSSIISMHDIYTHIYGNEYYLYPWKYKGSIFKEVKLTYEIANEVFKNYLKEFKTKGNVFNLDYEKIGKNAGLSKIINGRSLYFAVQYNKFKYPGYMFKTKSPKYYKEESNLLFDLKYFIEQDLNIPIDKIPLYLTKNVLQQRCRSLYHFIVTGNKGSIYEWVNKLYPDKFIIVDFEVNGYRNEFDSDIECFIHELLKSKFSNVLYNPKHSVNTITIGGMIPDWLVFTNSGVWIIEYFGMYVQRQYDNNTRVRDYIDKTHRKIEKYKEISGYNFIFLYPDDIVDDYKGCREKLAEIENM